MPDGKKLLVFNKRQMYQILIVNLSNSKSKLYGRQLYLCFGATFSLKGSLIPD